MSKLRLISAHGDSSLAEWSVDQPETLERARAAFAQHFTKGRMAFRIDGPGQSSPLREFDQTAPEILLVPAVTGG